MHENIESTFDNSVAIILYSQSFKSKAKIGEEANIIEIRNFSNDFVLNSEYYIEGIQYTDNGEFNDEIAGDGLYTSIQTFPKDSRKSKNSLDKLSFGQDFKFNKELKRYLKSKYGGQSGSNSRLPESGGKMKFGYKVRTIACPETGWWNSCYPLSSPCTCVEFYDCELSVEIEF
ncbi:MAG: hypothetical protein ACR2MS_06990 [Weeksellaceae bacterium]